MLLASTRRDLSTSFKIHAQIGEDCKGITCAIYFCFLFFKNMNLLLSLRKIIFGELMNKSVEKKTQQDKTLYLRELTNKPTIRS